ncbi:NAD(P)/FAD-dependent oxidoreductase [SAR86 cluster bacterium]|nr:NAD(P)/FAD-dependent oxidoreductase [SAR86 cluster bacterium]
MNKEFDVIILGAGAAGLMTALTAAKRQKRVLVLEKSNKEGKKILMSGGGKSNFTNLYVEAENFLSENPHFCKSALNRFTPDDFIRMVEEHQIDYEQKKHQQLFCINSSKDILNMLLSECADSGVEILTNADTKRVNKLTNEENKIYYEVVTHLDAKKLAKKASFQCDSLVIATGALSIPSLGGSGFGYELAKEFNLTLIPRRASLVPFMFSDEIKGLCEKLSGLSVMTRISTNGTNFLESMLFTHRGLSGPVILQISNYWNPGDEININLWPDNDLSEIFFNEKNNNPKTTIKKKLNSYLPKALVTELEDFYWPNEKNLTLAEISNERILKITNFLNNWTLKPAATEGYRTAEVTLGGVNTDLINSKTMETKEHPGLFFVGEVLDVTGHLGGYNFQWAWASGYSAGLVV